MRFYVFVYNTRRHQTILSQKRIATLLNVSMPNLTPGIVCKYAEVAISHQRSTKDAEHEFKKL